MIKCTALAQSVKLVMMMQQRKKASFTRPCVDNTVVIACLCHSSLINLNATAFLFLLLMANLILTLKTRWRLNYEAAGIKSYFWEHFMLLTHNAGILMQNVATYVMEWPWPLLSSQSRPASKNIRQTAGTHLKWHATWPHAARLVFQTLAVTRTSWFNILEMNYLPCHRI